MKQREKHEEVVVCTFCYGVEHTTDMVGDTLQAETCHLCKGKGKMVRKTITTYEEIQGGNANGRMDRHTGGAAGNGVLGTPDCENDKD